MARPLFTTILYLCLSRGMETREGATPSPCFSFFNMRALRSSTIVLGLLVAGVASSNWGAKLQLGGAVFESSCGGGTHATVKFVAGGVDEMRGLSSVRLVLHGVPFTCANVPLSEPCATTDTDYPRLWTCAWTSTDGTTSTSEPLYAGRKADTFDGETIGIGVYVDCPPPGETFVMAHKVPGADGSDVSRIPLQLSLRHHGAGVPTNILFGSGVWQWMQGNTLGG